MREFFSVHSHRRQILLAGTALVVAYVRSFFQYHQYGWNSVLEFLTSWFIHYIAVIVFIVVAGAVAQVYAKHFLGDQWNFKELTIKEVYVYAPLFVLVAAVMMFLIAHWPHTSGDRYE